MDKQKRYKMAFAIQSAFRMYIALKTKGTAAKEEVLEQKSKNEIIEIYKRRHEHIKRSIIN